MEINIWILFKFIKAYYYFLVTVLVLILISDYIKHYILYKWYVNNYIVH